MERSQNSGVDPICVHLLWLWLTLIVSGELHFIHTALLWRQSMMRGWLFLSTVLVVM